MRRVLYHDTDRIFFLYALSSVYAVPVKYQVLFTNLVELVWNAYLSFATEGGGHGHGGGEKQIEQQEEAKKEL